MLVVKREQPFWAKHLNSTQSVGAEFADYTQFVFSAPSDTTFALYPPGHASHSVWPIYERKGKSPGWHVKAVRVSTSNRT